MTVKLRHFALCLLGASCLKQAHAVLTFDTLTPG